MKDFIKLVREYRSSNNGRVLHRKFLEALESTKHYKKFLMLRKQMPTATWKQLQHIYCYGISKCCLCDNDARWFDREERFSNWCGIQCQNSDPDKLGIQVSTYKHAISRRNEGLENEAKSYKRKLVESITRKHVDEFRKLHETLKSSKGVLERQLVNAMTETQKKVWFNLNHDSYRYRLLIATGKMPIRAYCKRCEKELTTYHQNGWATYCGNKCAGIETVSYRTSPEARKKACITNKKRFENPVTRKKQSENFAVGLMKRYGVSNASQVYEIASKRMAKLISMKEYRLGNRTVKVQGYEPYALDYLQKWFGPKEIQVSSEGTVPVITYEFKDKTKVHYPDIFIPSKNLLIEVKSSYTCFGTHQRWNTLRKKSLAAKENGYSYSVILLERRTLKRIRLPDNWELISCNEIRRWFTASVAAACF